MDPPLSNATSAMANPPPPSSAAGIQLVYPESYLDSSPGTRAAAESWVPSPTPNTTTDDPLPPIPGGGKLRLMCSYGGHIVPRPHDKSLCYVGGDTRIVVVDRGSSLSDLCARLSKTLLHGRPFTLKYQLPSEELDSLISVTTDEDLDNMVDEYDRTAAGSPLHPSRLRLFLFYVKPESAASMGALLDDAKSETWFVDALNGSGLLPRGLSDSAVDNCLLADIHSAKDDLPPASSAAAAAKSQESAHYACSAPDSPLVENNNSSYGSSSSSPSMSNLPPIRVRVDDHQNQKPASIEEQFAQIAFAPAAVAPPPVKVLSDDERSDHSAPAVGFRKPPLPLQQPKPGNGGGAGYALPSPDSVTSESGSVASASSLSKPVYYQQQDHPPQQQQIRETRGPGSPNITNEAAVPGTHLLHQTKDGYLLPPHHLLHHQQYTLPMQPPHQQQPQQQPYYQIYPPQAQQQQFLMEQQQQQQQQYSAPPPQPVYVMSYSDRASTASPGIPPAYPQAQHYAGPTYSQMAQHHHQHQQQPGQAYYAGPTHEQQVYYAPPPPSQYQSMTPAAAIALSEAAKQLPPPDNSPVSSQQPQ